MAILKSLIVNGVSKHLQDTYLSTIKSGTWNGSTIGVAYGGTGVTSSKGSSDNPVYLSSSGIAACTSLALTTYNNVSFSTGETITWTNPTTGAITISTSGTYIIQITYTNSSYSDVYSGVFSISGATSPDLSEEIALFKSGSSSTPRIYASIQGKTLKFSSTVANSTFPITIKIRRVI